MTQHINPATPVYVQQTCTGSELTSAAIIGFFTAGPLGIWASRKALKEFQGKWGAWFMTGLIGAPVCLVAQMLVLSAFGFVIAVFTGANSDNSDSGSLVQPSRQSVPTAPTAAPVAISDPAPIAPKPEPTIAIPIAAPSPPLTGLFTNDPFIEPGMK